ncbi:hypothetical protein BDP27DRAFT_1419014 [Rhodocollybia butyracea]|uniref:Uncharacterized protein n=1 Tax=Rhodocollybia butyracea TaxID=206335 RepID=A0A9P5PWW8_9AGAR|nr:hypothetical protein BDP27DRAFT_1419014 [Rhodocollybia butyracea]
MSNNSHPELRNIRDQLKSIHESISHFQPPAKKPPILDSSLEVIQNPAEDTHWLQHDSIPGLKKLKESIKIDLDVLDKFLDDPESDSLPPLSTNAPYLIAVWNEVLCARAPVIYIFKSFLSTEEGSRVQSTKVDVVADCGRQWIRLNTIKNFRLLSEFREIDSYLTDGESSDENDEDYRPSLAQKEFDNSILRMGRSLVAAAKAHPVQLPISNFEEIPPRITMRLTRLNPDAEPTEPPGERTLDEIPQVQQNTAPHPSSIVFEPTTKINLDLSVLIALVSDLTHSALPTSIDEANTRFIPPERYLEWKKKVNSTKAKAKKLLDPDFNDEDFELSLPAQHDMAKTSRALTNQVEQEMGKGLLQEMADKLNALTPEVPSNEKNIEFWTTREARDRCLRIVSKVGGLKEKRRAQALLFDAFSSNGEQDLTVDGPDLDEDYPLPPPDTLEEAEEAFWGESRYPQKLLSLIPLRFYPAPSELSSTSVPVSASFPATPSPDALPPFFRSLHSTCSDILEYEKHSRSKGGPRSLKGKLGLGPNSSNDHSNHAKSLNILDVEGDESPSLDNEPESISGFPRAIITKANPRLTAHTVQSLAWGSALGWTTLTANRTSVKAIVKEINARARVEMFEMYVAASEPKPSADGPSSVSDVKDACGGLKVEGVSNNDTNSSQSKAAIWVIDPRSLAEGMRADSVDD